MNVRIFAACRQQCIYPADFRYCLAAIFSTEHRTGVGRLLRILSLILLLSRIIILTLFHRSFPSTMFPCISAGLHMQPFFCSDGCNALHRRRARSFCIPHTIVPGTITAPSQHHHSTITAPSLHHKIFVDALGGMDKEIRLAAVHALAQV